MSALQQAPDPHETFDAVRHSVAKSFGLSPRKIVYKNRRHGDPNVSRAKLVALYLCVVGGGLRLRAAAAAAGCSAPYIHRVLRLVEDARDDPDFDAQLEQLEEELKPC